MTIQSEIVVLRWCSPYYKTRSRDCLESPDGGRPCALPGAENGSEGPPLGASRYRRPYLEGSTTTFQTVSLGTWVNIVEVNAPGAISVVLSSRLKPYGDDVAVAVGVAVEVVVSSSRVVLGRGVCSVVVAG